MVDEALIDDRPTTRPATTKPAATQPIVIPGVMNFARVSANLYRGAQPTGEGFAELKKRGIRTVVDLRSFHGDRELLKGLGMRYVRIYCKTWHPEEEDTIKILKVIEDPANWPVFVHCQQGADRTGCAVAAYRVVNEGWTMEEARREMEAFGFHRIWREISGYLRRFDVEAMKKKVAGAKGVEVEVVP